MKAPLVRIYHLILRWLIRYEVKCVICLTHMMTVVNYLEKRERIRLDLAFRESAEAQFEKNIKQELYILLEDIKSIELI